MRKIVHFAPRFRRAYFAKVKHKDTAPHRTEPVKRNLNILACVQARRRHEKILMTSWEMSFVKPQTSYYKCVLLFEYDSKITFLNGIFLFELCTVQIMQAFLSFWGLNIIVHEKMKAIKWFFAKIYCCSWATIKR